MNHVPLMSELPCLKCGKASEPAYPFPDQETPPGDALLFISYGHYGSGVFDSLAGSEYLLAVICDDCITEAGARGIVLLCRKQRPVFPDTTRELWSP